MTSLNIQTAHFPPIPVAMIRHRGPYEGLSAEFDRLWAWVELNNVPAKRSIGIYYDNPDYVSAGQLRSAACVEIPAGYAIPTGGGAPVEMGTVAGGEYATLRFTGPYEELEKVWSGMTNHIKRKMRRQIPDDIPAFEVYVNDPSDTPPNALITDLFMPVR